MANGDPEVTRVIDYGGDVTESIAGGRAVEYWAVINLACNQIVEAHNLGLPAVNAKNPDPRLAFVGPVKEVQRVQEFGARGWLARVIYSTAGSFSTQRLGTRTSQRTELLSLPLYGTLGSTTPPSYFRRDQYVPRPCFSRCISIRYGGDTESVLNTFEDNVGKLYRPALGSWITQNLMTGEAIGARQYQLDDISIVTDSGNNSRIDTYFKYRSGVRPIATNAYPGQTRAIPQLPANADYVFDDSTATIGTTNVVALYGTGSNLFWL